MPQDFTEVEEEILEELPDELEEYIRLKQENQRLRREMKILEIQKEKNRRLLEIINRMKEDG